MMKNESLQHKFAWRDVIEGNSYEGWGWSQNCTVRDGKVEIDCLQLPSMLGVGMKLHVTAAEGVTLLDYTDTGFVLHEYVAQLPFEAVVTRLLNVRATPVHLAAPELLSALSKEGLLTQLAAPQRRRRGQLTH